MSSTQCRRARAPSPVAIDGSHPLRAQGRVAVSATAGVTLVVQQRADGWKIIEELQLRLE